MKRYENRMDSAENVDSYVDLSLENEHGVLEGQEAVKSYLEDNHSEEVVDDLYRQFGWMYDWKAHRRSEDGVKLAVAYARALNLDEEGIKSYEDVDVSEVTDDHVAAVNDLHNIGRKWFREQFGDSVEVYRGVKNGGMKILDRLYRDDSDTVLFSDNVLNNWSWEIEPAIEWGKQRSRFSGAAARVERSIDDFVFTIDGIAGDYVNYHDSAITFEGGVEVPKDQVSIELHGNSVRDFEVESDDGFDREWVFYEGSFFPHRPMDAQDLEALKSAAIEFGEETSPGVRLEDEVAADFVETITDLRSHLEEELTTQMKKIDRSSKLLKRQRKVPENT